MKVVITIAFCISFFATQAQNPQKPSLTILPPFVLSGGISDHNLIIHLRDSLFDATISPGEYKRYTDFENRLQASIVYVYNYYLKKYYDLNFLKVSAEDSTVMANEIKSMKVKKIDSSETIKIPSAMDKIFSKYSTSSSAILVTTVTDYYELGALGSHRMKPTAFTLLEIFVIDGQKRNITFYNSKLNKWLGGAGGLDSDDIKKTLKGFVKK